MERGYGENETFVGKPNARSKTIGALDPYMDLESPAIKDFSCTNNRQEMHSCRLFTCIVQNGRFMNRPYW